MMTKEQLTALASVQGSPAASIYLPGHEDSRDIRQGAARLENALSAATDRLVEQGHRLPEVDALLAPAQALCDDQQFWRQECRSLAIFVAPGLFQMRKVPIELAKATVVGPRPHVKPLLHFLADDGRFFVLTATAGDTHLYAASRFGSEEVEADIPRSVAEGASVWGTCDEAEDRARVDRKSTPGSQDPADHAAIQTLLQGGNVHVLPAEEMPPRGCPMVAILRS